jgi:UDP-2,4-diacetamido-2,4,6-trideoxy-beta-L-altropyranose hydrolase
MIANRSRARRAVFVCSTGPQIGGGHVKRCVNLAHALTRRGWTCRFVVNRDALEADAALASGHFEVIPDDIDIKERLTRLEAGFADWIVLDDPLVTAETEALARDGGSRCLSFVDDPDRSIEADAVLATGIAARREQFKLPEGTLALCGPGFAPLAPAFRDLAQRTGRRRDEAVSHIVISFGLTDPAGATLVALRALEALCVKASVTIVLGRLSRVHSAAMELASKSHLDVRVVTDLPDLADLFSQADLVIGAAGTSSIERAVLGVPTIAVPIVDNQRANADALAQANAAVVLDMGPGLENELRECVARLLSAAELRDELASSAKQLCDSWGGDRVAAALDDRSRGLVLRKATWSDAETLYRWQQHPGTRRFANNPAVPAFEDHLIWLHAKLRDPNCCFNIIQHGGTDAGFLRFDRAPASASWIVSIASAPEKRAKGVATAALEAAKIMLAGNSLEAEVHEGNAASLRLFERAGFRRTTHAADHPGMSRFFIDLNAT